MRVRRQVRHGQHGLLVSISGPGLSVHGSDGDVPGQIGEGEGGEAIATVVVGEDTEQGGSAGNGQQPAITRQPAGDGEVGSGIKLEFAEHGVCGLDGNGRDLSIGADEIFQGHRRLHSGNRLAAAGEPSEDSERGHGVLVRGHLSLGHGHALGANLLAQRPQSQLALTDSDGHQPPEVGQIEGGLAIAAVVRSQQGIHGRVLVYGHDLPVRKFRT